MPAQQAVWPGPPPENKMVHVAAVSLAFVALLGTLYQFAQEWRGILALRPLELHLSADLPENGGWRGEPLRVESGQSVKLHVESVTGTHSFALAQTEVSSSRLLAPGESEIVTFTAPAPGRYVLYCTNWCSPNHWRMRTVLEVIDRADPDAPVSYPQTPQRYQLTLTDLPLDEPHPADVWPEVKPSAVEGAALWQTLGVYAASRGPLGGLRHRETAAKRHRTPQDVLSDLGWPVITPVATYEALKTGQASAIGTAQSVATSQQWALVAYLWQQSTTPAALARGAELFEQNCADCHGLGGKGDGIAASFAAATVPDMGDSRSAVGASPALYYAKIARGGMGTGMPNWGTILAEDDMWALADYLYSFIFDYSAREE